MGKTTGNHHLLFFQNGTNPIDLMVKDMLGNTPKTLIQDNRINKHFAPIPVVNDKIEDVIRKILQLEAVACKDWLTNKVDRSVSGKVA